VTASEFAFLALGLVLGVASGAALVEVLRARPLGGREIRVTVAPNSIHPRRAATLADDAFSDGAAGPAAGGPGDRRWNDADAAPTDDTDPGRRTDDRSPDLAPHGDLGPFVRTPVQDKPDGGPTGGPSTSSIVALGGAAPAIPGAAVMWPSPTAAAMSARMVAVPMSLEPDPITQALRATVAPNSIHPRRAATLADDAFSDSAAGPAAGGPGDRRWNDADAAPTDDTASGRRTDDRSPDLAPHGDLGPFIRTPVQDKPDGGPTSGASTSSIVALGGAAPAIPGAAVMWPSPTAAAMSARMVAVPMSLEPDPITQALRATAARVAVAATGAGGSLRPAPDSRGEGAASAGLNPRGEISEATKGQAGPEPPTPTASSSTAASPAAADRAPVAAPPSGGGAPSDAGPCAEERRVAEERCAVASRAREGAAGAAEALRATQRAYDAHVGNAEAAATAADPRSVRSAKEAAQRRFRDARSKATTREAVEGAARAWLSEINDINRDTREATVRMERDRAAATALAPVLERLAVEDDAARISAERADEACIAAREAVALCDEARTLEVAAAAAASSQAPVQDRIAPAMPAPEDEFEPTTPMGSRAGEDAVLIRILRGDREAMLAAVAKLAGDDIESRRRWQAWLSALAEALIARSIEASAFDFPLEHFFWGPFSQTTNRDIAAALASIGYRFDGFGGWADERVPSQRDLSMAVGYAGEDPMRIRRWPTEPEMLELLAEVRVAADEYIAGAAGGLTLGEMVTLLGRRADALTELWNEWGIVRPILLEAI
jgi:hypothetical protein